MTHEARPSNDTLRVGLLLGFVAAAVAGLWLRVAQVEANVEARLAALPHGAADGWRTFVSPDDAYQLELPPGTRLTHAADAAYVVSTDDPSAMPIAIVQAVPAGDRGEYGGGIERLVGEGDRLYRLYPWQHEPWPPFDRVVASFRLL